MAQHKTKEKFFYWLVVLATWTILIGFLDSLVYPCMLPPQEMEGINKPPPALMEQVKLSFVVKYGPCSKKVPGFFDDEFWCEWRVNPLKDEAFLVFYSRYQGEIIEIIQTNKDQEIVSWSKTKQQI